jgi:polyisoprenyl-phosphate glycosyltransferase
MKKIISILVPVYNESRSLPRLYEELEKVTAPISSYDFRYVFVDDGSTDESCAVLSHLAKRDGNITVIELSRNFGKEVAVTAGMHNVDSDAVIIMDADLQHPPAVIPEFIRQWEQGFDIVATKRTNFEKRSLVKRIASHAFYRLMSLISEVDMVSQTTDFRLLDKKVIELFNSFTERNRMVRGIIDWMGFKKTYIEFEAPQRFAGTSVYGYKKLLSLAVNSITSFSSFPLKLTGYLGLVISTLSGLGMFIIVVDKFTFNHGQFTFLGLFMMLNTFMTGLVLISLGLIALYIGNIHVEVVNRPLYIIRSVTKNGKVVNG